MKACVAEEEAHRRQARRSGMSEIALTEARQVTGRAQARLNQIARDFVIFPVTLLITDRSENAPTLVHGPAAS